MTTKTQLIACSTYGLPTPESTSAAEVLERIDALQDPETAEDTRCGCGDDQPCWRDDTNALDDLLQMLDGE